MLKIVHDGVADENHLGLQLAILIALLCTLPIAIRVIESSWKRTCEAVWSVRGHPQ